MPDKGFTLIELIISMSILGLVIALTLPFLVGRYQIWALDAAANQVVFNIRDLAESGSIYKIQKGISPTGVVGGTPDTLQGAGLLRISPRPPGPYSYGFETDAKGILTDVVSLDLGPGADLCKRINEITAGAGASVPVVAGGNISADPVALAREGVFCYSDGSNNFTARSWVR